jgi:serine beta-lactamase-like protein LACTB, mitochondrial
MYVEFEKMRAITELFSHAVLLILSLPICPAAQNQAGLPRDTLNKVEAVITSEMARAKIPGVSVAIVTNNQLQWANGYGFADVENFVPAKASTAYRIASLAKPITAVAVMQLSERGKLDLGAPIQKYCPAFPQKQWTITAGQLLAHLGGVRHYRNVEEFTSTKHYNSLVEALEVFKGDPLLAEPGTRFSYSTFGYVLLGCAVEGASGKQYPDYIRDNVARLAGMTDLRVDDASAIIPNRAQGYRRTENGELQNSPFVDNSGKMPGGGFTSTVEDLARFAVAVQTAKLLKPETVKQMWTVQKTRDGNLTPGGLGWAITERNGRREIYHTGGQPRVSTVLYILPDKNFAIAMMANLEGVNMQGFVRQIADAVQPQ